MKKLIIETLYERFTVQRKKHDPVKWIDNQEDFYHLYMSLRPVNVVGKNNMKEHYLESANEINT